MARQLSEMDKLLREAPIVEVVIAIEVNKGRRNLSIYPLVIASIAAIWLLVLKHPEPDPLSVPYGTFCIIAAAVAVLAALAACTFQWNISIFSGELKRRRSEHSAMEDD